MFLNDWLSSRALISPADTSELIWIRKHCAGWMQSLMAYDVPCSDSFFRCVGWTLGGVPQLLKSLQTDLAEPAGRTREAVTAKKAIRELAQSGSRRPDRALENLYDENPILQDAIRDIIRSYLADWLQTSHGKSRSIFPRGFASLFSLDGDALELCAFAWGLGNYRNLENFFEDELELNCTQNAPLLARALSIPPGRFRQLRCHLVDLGILEEGHNCLRLSDCIEEALGMGSLGRLQKFFCKTVPSTDVPLDQFRIPGETKRHALRLLGQHGSAPAHLLLYGEPGTGKTSFAARLAATLGVRAWAVACRDTDTVSDRRVSLTACMNLSSLHPRSLVIIDEAERLLDTDALDTRNGSSKAWLNSLLERKGLRFIWITNKVEHIDPAVRRRFSFSIHFENLGRSESLQMWSNVASRLHVEKRFPREIMEQFAGQYPVPVAMMENAVRQAKSISGKKDFCDCMERILESYLTLSGNGQWNAPRNESGPEYDPLAVCAATPVNKLVERLERLREKLLSSGMRGRGNLLFYGPPGTGKTALAKYLARKLDCECLCKRASDLMSPYVGETEQKIARAFSQAERSRALLLVDEVDSFIFSRESARQSWEQSMVNEFLTSLENFAGICICTTNFRKMIDSAAMRRFPFKVEFRYAEAAQLKKLYAALLAPLCASSPNEDVLARVCAQKHLAPGDFHAVRSQFWLEDPADVTHESLLHALLLEQKLKLEKEAKKVGFEI